MTNIQIGSHAPHVSNVTTACGAWFEPPPPATAMATGGAFGEYGGLLVSCAVSPILLQCNAFQNFGDCRESSTPVLRSHAPFFTAPDWSNGEIFVLSDESPRATPASIHTRLAHRFGPLPRRGTSLQAVATVPRCWRSFRSFPVGAESDSIRVSRRKLTDAGVY